MPSVLDSKGGSESLRNIRKIVKSANQWDKYKAKLYSLQLLTCAIHGICPIQVPTLQGYLAVGGIVQFLAMAGILTYQKS